MTSTDVAIIGAGPNGIALAAHLGAAGVDHVVLGRPFGTWREHMPTGMLLKSEPYGSDVAAPRRGYALRDFCLASGIAYVDRVEPVALSTFLAYADWYTKKLGPEVLGPLVATLNFSGSVYSLRLEDGSELSARRVVVATGTVPFAHIPAVLRALPPGMVSHSCDHRDPSALKGRRIAIIGAGQSALELGALAHEAGAEVELLVREPSLFFHPPMSEVRGWRDKLRHPASPLCEGWHCWLYYHCPDLFRGLPEHERALRARTFLGPAGARWLRTRVEGQFPAHTSCRVAEASRSGEGAKLVLDSGGRRRSATYDHVIAGTGFRTDLSRLSFLPADLRKEVRVAGGAPVLSRSFESSVSGLFFVGFPAAASLGPSMRFLAGTHFTARRLAGHLSRRRPGPATVDAMQRPVDLSQAPA
ncbi:MAG TPA: FAD-dependent oxidoreductase [Acidimicrobiales bacterium]|nr:FAD-dependent oxidoreductase [Acidimicrobiales bacterium]